MNRVVSILLVLSLITFSTQGQVLIFDNEFASRPFGRTITLNDISVIFPIGFSKSSSPIRNIHTGNADTLVCFKYGDNEITFLKTIDRVFFSKAIIVDSSIKLARNISIGISLQEIARKFQYNEKLNDNVTIVIADQDEYRYHKFYFEGGILIKVVLDSGPD